MYKKCASAISIPAISAEGGCNRDVCRGASYLSPRMLSQLVDEFRTRIKSANRQPRFAPLTVREKEILKFLAEGESVKEIASGLKLQRQDGRGP